MLQDHVIKGTSLRKWYFSLDYRTERSSQEELESASWVRETACA